MRTYFEQDGLGNGKTRTIRQFWDKHGGYQWTYFDEKIKQHIEYFLLQRLHGRNLEVGGGWYLSYPDSDVVDVSKVCLDYNLAPKERKHLFDLDGIAKGKKLPFEKHTFDSATLISVWQYLPKPWPVVKELERVLKPGAEMYLINGDGAGVSELIVNQTRSSDIEESFRKRGYGTLLEPIPDSQGGTGEFNSVCVALPRRIGGKRVSRVKDCKRRRKAVESFSGSAFLENYGEWELGTKLSKLRQLEEYPITAYSRGLLERIEEYGRDYERETGDWPVFFLNHSSRIEFDMSVPDDIGNYDMEAVGIKDAACVSEPENISKRDLWFGRCHGYLPVSFNGTLKDAQENLKKAMERLSEPRQGWYDSGREEDKRLVRKAVEFLACPKLNTFARRFGEALESVLKPYSRLNLNSLLKAETASKLEFLAYQHKQRRCVDELIARKKELESEPGLVAGTGKLELGKYVPYMRRYVVSRLEVPLMVDEPEKAELNQLQLDDYATPY